VIVYVEAKVADVVQGILGRVHGDVALGRVEHVRHAHAPKVIQVLDRLPVGQEDARVHLKKAQKQAMKHSKTF
jgi:hypothetical protein